MKIAFVLEGRPMRRGKMLLHRAALRAADEALVEARPARQVCLRFEE